MLYRGIQIEVTAEDKHKLCRFRSLKRSLSSEGRSTRDSDAQHLRNAAVHTHHRRTPSCQIITYPRRLVLTASETSLGERSGSATGSR